MNAIKEMKIAEMKALYSMSKNNRKYGGIPKLSYNNPGYLTPFNSEILNAITHLYLGMVLNANIVTVYAKITDGGKIYRDILYVLFYPFILLYNFLF